MSNDPNNVNNGHNPGFSQQPPANPQPQFSPVSSPYTQPSQPTESFTATGQAPQNGQENQPPVFATPSEQPKPKRTIGLVPAIIMTVVASVLAGSITGIYAVRSTGSNSSDAVYNSLKQTVSNNEDAAPTGVQAVADAVLPTVVSIQVRTRSESSEGSGSIISSDGYVMTNNHVVSMAEGQQSLITVVLNDGSSHTAKFIAGDSNTDVAVIKIDNVKDLPTIGIGNSDDVAVGQQVVAIGSPLGLSATVTTGIISAKNRPVRAGGGTGESSLLDALQTDAAINPGNSGGPLVDMNGALVGMNSVIASLSTSDSEAGSIGLGFAIPANFARRVAQQLIDTGKVTHPMIGIQLESNADTAGAVIAEVTSDGPGAKAGLKPGEVVVGMNGRVIDSADALIAAVRSSDFGQVISLEVADSEGNNQRSVEVTLTSE